MRLLRLLLRIPRHLAITVDPGRFHKLTRTQPTHITTASHPRKNFIIISLMILILVNMLADDIGITHLLLLSNIGLNVFKLIREARDEDKIEHKSKS